VTTGALTLETITSGNLLLRTTTAGDISALSADQVVLGATTTVDIDGATVNVDSTGAISLDSATSSNFSTSGSASTLTLEAAGGSTNQVIINSAGTGSNAIRLNASAGGIDIDASGGPVSIVSSSSIDFTGAAASLITTTGAGIDLSLVSTSGRVVLQGGEAVADAVRINATTGGFDVDSVLSSTITVTGSAQNLVLEVAGGGAQQVRLQSAGTGTDSIDIDSSAGGLAINGVTGFALGASNSSGSTITSTNTTAATASQLDIACNNTGATSGDSTLGIDASSTNGTATINIGTTNADGINIGTNAVLASGTDSAFTFTDGTIQASGSVAIHSSTTSALILDSGTTGAISIGVDGTNAKTLNLDSGTTGDLNVGTSAFAKAVTVGNTTAGTTLALKAEGYQTINGVVALTDNTATTILTVALATGEQSGGSMRYTVYADDATDFQTYTRNLTWAAVNKAGTITVDVDNGTPTSQANSAGTLTVTLGSTTGASLFNIQVTADTSLTPTNLDCKFIAEEFGSQALTVA
jgi:hypothetical protein